MRGFFALGSAGAVRRRTGVSTDPRACRLAQRWANTEGKWSDHLRVERWPVKTLSDKREELVNFKSHDSSIGRLRKKPHPDVGPNTKRIKGVETTNYRVAAQLIEMKLEDDHDIHLVISVPGSPAKTISWSSPDTTCNGASSSPKRAKMASARSAVPAACGQPVLQPLRSA